MNKRVVLTACIFCLLLSPAVALADENVSRVPVYFFWGDGCPHCVHEKVFLEELNNKIPAVDVHSYEVWFHPENKKFYENLSKAYGTISGGVPATFIGDKVWVGYNEQRGREIEAKVSSCLQAACIDPADQIHTVLTSADIATTANTMSPAHAVCVEIFVRKGCLQCQNVMGFIEYLSRKFNIALKIHDVVEPAEKERYEKIKKQYALKSGAFPVVFIDDAILVGDQSVDQFLEEKISACAKKECRCSLKSIRGVLRRFPQPAEVTPENGSAIDIPLVGKFDAAQISLPVLTVILGGLDGFNPCAFFVLFLLLSLLVHAQSKRRMLLAGGIFVFFSGFIYFLFMAAWLNLFMVIGRLEVMTRAAGIIAAVIAVINIKEFFFFGKGVSLTIPESAKPKLYERMRGILKAGSMTGVVVGTIVLAIAANTYELLCTAGFPMVFARVLTLHKLFPWQYYFYLGLYNVIYVIPLLVIVIVFSSTLGARKLTEWQGRVLKLLSGLMMLGLGIILIAKPALLNNIFVSIGLMAGVLLVASFIGTVGKKYLNIK